jgi:hypothetical protein
MLNCMRTNLKSARQHDCLGAFGLSLSRIPSSAKAKSQGREAPPCLASKDPELQGVCFALHFQRRDRFVFGKNTCDIITCKFKLMRIYRTRS